MAAHEPALHLVSVETYTVELDGTPDRTLDSFFDRAWDRFCQVARGPLTIGRSLDPGAEVVVREWVAPQWARTPSADYFADRLVQAGITSELVERIINETVDELGVLPEAAAAIRDPRVLANLNSRLLSTRRRDQIEQVYRMLKEIGTWVIGVHRAMKPLVLSDHPVVLAEVRPDGRRTHVLYAVRGFDEVTVPLTPTVLLRLTRAAERSEAPTTDWYNAGATRQAYEEVVAQDRTDVPQAAVTSGGVPSLPETISRRAASLRCRTVPSIRDAAAQTFIGRTMRHEQRALDAVVREAVGRVLDQGPLYHASRQERRATEIDETTWFRPHMG